MRTLWTPFLYIQFQDDPFDYLTYSNKKKPSLTKFFYTWTAITHHRMTTDSSSCCASAMTRSYWGSSEMGCSSIEAGESSRSCTETSPSWFSKTWTFALKSKWILEQLREIGAKRTNLGALKVEIEDGFDFLVNNCCITGENCVELDITVQ